MAGKLFGRKVMAGGLFELRREIDDDEIFISAFLGLAFDGNWDDPKDKIIQDERAVQGQYDIESRTWTLEIDSY